MMEIDLGMIQYLLSEIPFRYATILLSKMKENDKNVSREPDFRYTTILLSKMKENVKK